ncbi:HNH endonuclease [Desulforamulus putei DSM 12395]|uniref:HNH endonuclease n=2 Tax=Desulforamulus putei TaxID=74701 RepID=A0A1M4SG12_9FIRM|nr:HNH endonuclease [Desulforamulus putei DSM 12395]
MLVNMIQRGWIMPLCVYCGQEKPAEQFSREHVIPRAIGGNLRPYNPFTLNQVCKRCNSICGTYIDGPFVKNWLTQNYRAEIAKKYVNINSNPILPLIYFGPVNGLVYKEKICELWLGPTGDTIYHFHEPYPEEPDVPPMVGIPTYARTDQIDHGFAFLFVRSNNPVWHPTILHSFNEQFKQSVISTKHRQRLL